MSKRLDDAHSAMGDALGKYFSAMAEGEVEIKGAALMESFIFPWGMYHLTIPYPDYAYNDQMVLKAIKQALTDKTEE